MAGNILGTTVYYDADCDLSKLEGKKITVLGYGSQGHAHALNLKEGGFDVTVGLRKGSKSWLAAEEAGFTVKETADAVKDADIVMILIPDELQAETYAKDIAPNLKEGAYIAFGHGFNIHFKKIVPREDISVFMVAPKGPGHLVRRTFQEGSGVPCLVAVEKDAAGDAMEVAKAWASAICGGVVELMKVGFEVLTEAGYDPVNAYFECIHEMKLIVDLIYEGGLATMRNSISNTAEYGDYITGPKIITPATKEAMRGVLKDIQSGKFADDFLADYKAGQPFLKEKREEFANHGVEKVGAELRKLMPWIKK